MFASFREGYVQCYVTRCVSFSGICRAIPAVVKSPYVAISPSLLPAPPVAGAPVDSCSEWCSSYSDYVRLRKSSVALPGVLAMQPDFAGVSSLRFHVAGAGLVGAVACPPEVPFAAFEGGGAVGGKQQVGTGVRCQGGVRLQEAPCPWEACVCV